MELDTRQHLLTHHPRLGQELGEGDEEVQASDLHPHHSHPLLRRAVLLVVSPELHLHPPPVRLSSGRQPPHRVRINVEIFFVKYLCGLRLRETKRGFC